MVLKKERLNVWMIFNYYKEFRCVDTLKENSIVQNQIRKWYQTSNSKYIFTKLRRWQ